ncbi:hypothetical protein IMF27_16535 [Pseudomonas sp. PCH199]|uniref:hypothetical protein n=1 Tax=unclassified Pseudomonas TaxID=196821 RepID=UPI000FFB31FC|nr:MULTISPECIES: hypothetical protein [unclassified Pseudomonas]MCW8277094.1 hypothetical protein [Pseudomonas sp. PCH199]
MSSDLSINAAYYRGVESPSLEKNGERVRSSLVTANNSSDVLQRKLDGLGVDASLVKLEYALDRRSPVVFSHKALDGESKLESGLFVSDQNSGDRYGEFRFYSGVGAKKYQSPECNVLAFNKASLEMLKNTYHDVVGVTQFYGIFLIWFRVKICRVLILLKNGFRIFSH